MFCSSQFVQRSLSASEALFSETDSGKCRNVEERQPSSCSSRYRPHRFQTNCMNCIFRDSISERERVAFASKSFATFLESLYSYCTLSRWRIHVACLHCESDVHILLVARFRHCLSMSMEEQFRKYFLLAETEGFWEAVAERILDVCHFHSKLSN